MNINIITITNKFVNKTLRDNMNLRLARISQVILIYQKHIFL